MQNDDIALPLDIYFKHLRTINGIGFTHREIDVIACLIGERSTRTIPSFLSVAARTVASHISRIRLKTGCTSQENIIDFVEHSDKFSVIKNQYYLSLLTQISFEKCLRKIPKVERAKAPLCLIVYEREQKDKYPFIHYLEDHLRLAGFKVESKIREGRKFFIDPLEGIDSQAADHILYIIPEALTNQLQPTENESNRLEFPPVYNEIQGESKFVFLSPHKASDTKGGGHFNCIHFSDTGNYYLSFFKLLKKLRKINALDNIVEAFRKSCEEMDRSREEVLSQVNAELPEKQEDPKIAFFSSTLKKRTKVFAIGLSSIGLICIFLLAIKIGNVWDFKETNRHSIRSDLPVPIKEAFLNRPGLMAQLNDKLKGQQGIQTIALVGGGGVGKTTLARQFGQQQKADVVWEINAETPENLQKSFYLLAQAVSQTEEDQKILRGLQETKDPIEKEEKLIQFVKNHLRTYSNWFLIYDNVEAFSDIQKYFPQDATTWGEGKVILTTRDGHIQNNNHINHVIKIGELDQTQKLDLFTKIMSQGNTQSVTSSPRQEINEFLDEIPPFPLDISVAAYYLKATNIPYKEYLERIHNNSKSFFAIQEKILTNSTNYTKTRHGIITSSLQNVINVHKDFSDLLLLISLLDSQNIPRDLLNSYKDPVVVDDFIYHLKKYSLASSGSSELALSIHRSTQAILLAHITKLLDLKQSKNLIYPIEKAFQTYAETALEKEDFQKMTFFVPHAETFLTHDYLLNDGIKGSTKGYLGCIYLHLGEYAKSEKLLNEALAILDQYGDKHYLRLGQFLAYLGVAYENLGNNQKALQSLEQSVVLFKRHFPENNVQYARALAHLGNIYRAQGNYKIALDVLENSLVIYQKNLPENDIKIGAAYVFLGHLNIDSGHYEKAINLLEKGFEIYKINVPEDHIGRGWILYFLGSAYMGIGNYEKALHSLEESLRICKKNFTETHTWVNWVVIQLGILHGKLGHYDKALNFLENGLKSYENHYGQNHIETARILVNLGEVYLLKGELNTAEAFLTKASKIFEKNKHPDHYMALEALAELHLKKSLNEEKNGDLDQARLLKNQAIIEFKESLEIVKEHFPKDSPRSMRIQLKLQNIGQEKL